MLNLLQEYVKEVLKLKVNYSNSTSLVKQQVKEFLHNSKRTCDRYKKIILAKKCYNIATRKKNRNTLFLILAIRL
jgi:hypothetical protein